MNNYLTQTTTYNSQDDYSRFSVSKLKCYKQCPQLFKQRYIEKLDSYRESDSTAIGTILHACLEYLYGTEDKDVNTAEDAFFKIINTELENLGINKPEAILGDLLDYHKDINHLYVRASSAYTGPDAIRTKSGQVPKALKMTGVWKSECRRLDLTGRKERIDNTISSSNTKLANVSITDVFSKAYILAKNYVTPNAIEDILYLELPLSEWNDNTNVLHNGVKFPGCNHENVYFNGYIDNVAKVKVDGNIVNAVIDYKTSKETFNPNIVSHNQQFLMYAAGVQELLNIPITHIGILSLTSGDLIMAAVDEDIQSEIISNFNKIIDKVFNNDFYKNVPDTKYSPCLNMFGNVCPMLEHCWSKSYDYLFKDTLQDDYFTQYYT